MSDKEITTPLIQSKLNRPPLPVDLVPRSRLTTWLEQHRERPLTLVSAPAGYGKSTLISCWLETAVCPTAWVSLDERDNELEIFLSYFLAAIRSIFPEALPETKASLIALPLPAHLSIAKTLINELNQIEQPFILVLDDYHLIEVQAIHNLINELLVHPPSSLHLVLGTRMDPPLPLVKLRARSQMTEIRITDLRFNKDESQQLFQQMIGAPIDQKMVGELDAQVEGWVTGLRLAALAMRHRIRESSLPGELSAQNRYVTEYLITEILTKQAANLSACMLKTSILERFCADLCQVICYQDEETERDPATGSKFNGRQFLEWLHASNLFVIPLDDQQDWFRYHHLFQDFLQQELVRRFTPEEIRKLHTVAGRWYAHNGWIEEALYHLLTAGDTAAAIELVAQHRYRLMNTTQWPRLERWLSSFSIEIIETSPELWMLKTWLAYQSGQWAEIPASIAHLDTILAEGAEPEMAQRLMGEISSLRGLLAYHKGDAEGTISHSRRALELIPPELWIARAFARMYLGGALLSKGDIVSSYQAFYSGLEVEKEQSKPSKATVLTLACYFHWITADLKGLEQASKQAETLCLEADYRQILGLSRYHLGCVRYHQNDLSAAENLFTWVVERPYQNYGTCYVTSVCGLAMTYQAQGKEAEARLVVETAIAFLLETGNMSQLPTILALQAEVTLRQENLPAASQWAAKMDPVPPLVPVSWFFAPHLTLVKVWLAQNTPASQRKASDLLGQLERFLTSIHNTRFLIDTFALQALLADEAGDQPTAQAALQKALRLAQPGGFIRVFVDLGPQMAGLLSQVKVDRGQQAFIKQILAAYSGPKGTIPSISQEELLEPLTNRELEVLTLLSERKTNKEIALQLGIGLGTVRQHAHNLYQKLEVSNRRDAVSKAYDSGVLPM